MTRKIVGRGWAAGTVLESDEAVRGSEIELQARVLDDGNTMLVLADSAGAITALEFDTETLVEAVDA